MREATIARSYAEALLELARADDAVETYSEALQQLVDWVETDERFRMFLDTPRIDVEEKKNVLREALAELTPDRVLKFLFVVLDKRRQRLLPHIADAYGELVDEHFGRLQVQVTTATEPDEGFQTKLRERLARIFDRKVLPHYRVDPRILGGVIVRVGDLVMDGSLRRRLQQIRRRLLRADLTLPADAGGSSE